MGIFSDRNKVVYKDSEYVPSHKKPRDVQAGSFEIAGYLNGATLEITLSEEWQNWDSDRLNTHEIHLSLSPEKRRAIIAALQEGL